MGKRDYKLKFVQQLHHITLYDDKTAAAINDNKVMTLLCYKKSAVISMQTLSPLSACTKVTAPE